MHPLVFTVQPYTIVFGIAVATWAVPERIVSFWLRASRDSAAKRQDHGSLVVVTVAILTGWGLGIGCALKWTDAAIPWLRPQLTVAGITLILLGVVLRWWAIITLGHAFTVDVAVRPQQAVVESGPYHLVRHPSYSALLLISIGGGLALANWASLFFMPVCTLLGLLYRVRVEERAMIDTLGQPYLEYRRRTKRFIPFVV